MLPSDCYGTGSTRSVVVFMRCCRMTSFEGLFVGADGHGTLAD